MLLQHRNPILRQAGSLPGKPWWHPGPALRSGGMAIVFLARDLKHKRPVALKVLHPEPRCHAWPRAVSARDSTHRPPGTRQGVAATLHSLSPRAVRPAQSLTPPPRVG
jgi:hypothetical protein